MYKLKIAEVCHNINKAYCDAIGDHSQSLWKDTPENIKASAIDGVLKVQTGTTAAKLHQSWCEFKLADGWVFGEEKNVIKKTHPCLVAYDELPHEQKIKDFLFQAVVESLT